MGKKQEKKTPELLDAEKFLDKFLGLDGHTYSVSFNQAVKALVAYKKKTQKKKTPLLKTPTVTWCESCGGRNCIC